MTLSRSVYFTRRRYWVPNVKSKLYVTSLDLNSALWSYFISPSRYKINKVESDLKGILNLDPFKSSAVLLEVVNSLIFIKRVKY